ncbi:MAG: acetaldehyde dehydrogenase (acetylating) [Bacillota bacterium]
MAGKVPVAIIGSGNVGTDLMYKILKRSSLMELVMVAGIDPASEGLARARSEGIATTHHGIDGLLEAAGHVRIVFDATSARAHLRHAPLLREHGMVAVDLTPAAVGPYVVPPANFGQHAQAWNVNLVTCGGQATIPMVHAVARVVPVQYGEIVATIASRSAGPGTRQNIDEFTITTRKGVVSIGGARSGKAIIILNPAEPPIMCRNTIYTVVERVDRKAIEDSVEAMLATVRTYVPGYRLTAPPLFHDRLVTIMVEVEGAGDYLPKYAGNLDIITSAAVAVGELLANELLSGRHPASRLPSAAAG